MRVTKEAQEELEKTCKPPTVLLQLNKEMVTLLRKAEEPPEEHQ